jgi:hypothetical protein
MDIMRPQITDPFTEPLKWRPSAEANVYYFWAHNIPVDMTLEGTSEVRVDCEHDNHLSIYVTSSTKVELLYRMHFAKKPTRFLCRPFDHALFWSYGKTGGPSKVIKYLFKDKNLSINKWVDKDSYLSVLRTNHFAAYDQAFWSR